RAYKQFLAGVRAGRSPRLIVTGRPGAGKTVLLDHLQRALEEVPGLTVRRLGLEGDVAGVLALASSGTSWAGQAAAQAEAARRALPQAPGVLLVRVTADLRFGGEMPRSPDGSLTPAAWAAEHLLRRAPPGVA
ncbi:AAA family ATPase, partial [Deinococcus sp. MIMF12]|nr:AAA family ATPase [Deinococcus rhizophilus]